MPDRNEVVVAGASGAWGDSSLSTRQLLDDGRASYLVYDGLAEITMAILTRARASDPTHGYATDIIEVIAAHSVEMRERNVRAITNAGGVNPHAAAALISASDPDAKVAVIDGDDLAGTRFMPEGAMSANAYLGSFPIAAALDAGADVVITGRVVDSALTLGPLIHEFGWGPEDLDLLSAGSLAGHLLECGPQASGGLLTDWNDTRSWVNPGFPLAEVAADGSFLVTKPGGTDGIVDVRTVTEQLLYEIGDPRKYLLPDVTCDWSSVTVDEVGTDQVRVSGAVGSPAPATLKACAQIPDGWKLQMLLFVAGREAVAKAERMGANLLERAREHLGIDFRATNVEVVGAEESYGEQSRVRHNREVVLRLAVSHTDRDELARFAREVPSIGLGGPPGVSGGGSGLPRPSPMIRLDCFEVPREAVVAHVELSGKEIPVGNAPVTAPAAPAVEQDWASPAPDGDTIRLPLISIAHARSGDKGADVNIGVRARHPDLFDVLVARLTPALVAAHLNHLEATEVRRYLLPGIHALNFVLVGGLGAGGTASLRFDPQGKAVAQQLLDVEVDVPVELLDLART